MDTFVKGSTQIFKSVGHESRLRRCKKSLWEDTTSSEAGLRNARLNLEKRDDKPAAIFFS